MAQANGKMRLEAAARSLQMAWYVVQAKVSQGTLLSSHLTRSRYMSTSCTGAYTAEVALALIEKIVNQSSANPVRLESLSCHAPCSNRYSVCKNIAGTK